MTRGNGFVAVAVILFAGLYAYFFTDWFKKKTIEIVPQNRPFGITREGSAVNPISFTMNGEYKLTRVKVVPVAALSEKTPLPVWDLVTTTNSAPVRGFLYGLPIDGMKDSKLLAKAEDLIPDVPYRIFVEAGRAKGQADFKPVAATPR